MNYEKASDFEINRTVAIALGMIVQDEFSEHLGFTERYHEQYPNTVWAAKCDAIGNQSEAWEQFCPCNSWSDIGQLIEECGISLININCTGNWFACSNVEFETICMSPDGSDNGVSCFNAKNESYCTNPKRAAAICYLKMKERGQ